MDKTSKTPSQPADGSADKARSKAMMGLRKHGGAALWVAMLLPLVGGGLLVWQAWALADLLDRAITQGVAANVLLPAVALVGGLLLARALLGAVGERAGTAAAEAIKLNVRRGLFAQMLGRTPRAAEQSASGAAAAAVIDQVEALDGFFAKYLPAMVQAAFLPLAFGIVVMPVDWVAGVLFVATAPLIPFFMALAGWGAQLATDRQAVALSRLNGRFADRLRGLLTLKLFGRAEVETAGIVQASDELRRRSLRVLRIAFLSSAVLEFFAALGVAGIALYVGLTFIDYFTFRTQELTLAGGLFLLLMAPEIYNPLRLLASHYHDRAAAKAGIAEIERQLGTLPTTVVPLTDAAAVIGGGAMAVSLSQMTLRTPDRARLILAEANLDIAAGEHVAIVGPSGVGKTSLVEAIGALRGFEGGIVLGGRTLGEWPESELRGRVAMLGQKPRIFYGSIAENIAMARPGASRAEVERAAHLAMVDDFADTMADGLDTLLGEGGIGISGGQAQRVALARIYLRDPGLVLLDEPTAHLDAAMEGEIIDRLARFCRGRTLIVATHSAQVASRMDRALRMAGHGLLPVPTGGRRTRENRA